MKVSQICVPTINEGHKILNINVLLDFDENYLIHSHHLCKGPIPSRKSPCPSHL